MELEDRIINKLKEVASLQQEHNGTLVRLTVTVEEHVRRSNMLEAAHIQNKERIDNHDKLIEQAKGAFWVLTLVGSAVLFFVKVWTRI